jgi:hypothetical protein
MTEKTCSRCGETRTLHFFRRWKGRKRAVHAVCSVCQPEKKISEMTPKERVNASAAGRPRAHIAVVLAMNQREADKLRYTIRPQQALSQHRATRRAAWRDTLGKRLVDEHAWATSALASARRACADGLPEGPAWAAFFSAYADVLMGIRQTIAMKHYEPGPRKLTMDEADPASHIPNAAATLNRLRLLYGACRPIPGRRTYRDPWFLTWGDSLSPLR